LMEFIQRTQNIWEQNEAKVKQVVTMH